MEIINWGILDKKLNLDSSAAAIGNFDGVHLGHVHVLKQAKKYSRKLHLPLTILTFEPHPREFFSKNKEFFKLQNCSEKSKSLKEHGVDCLIKLKFDHLLSELSPEEFIKEILCDNLSIKHVFVGKDFKFGKDRQGNIETLKTIGKINKLNVSDIAIKNKSGLTISSTKIREYLKAGNIETANRLLGRPYMISDLVIEGDKRGRKINFPTANISLNELIRPAFGVYAVKVSGIGVKSYNGIANIGKRPTVNDRGELLEVNIFDFDGDLYGKEIKVSLLKFIREEQKFDGLGSLKEQIIKDVYKAKNILKSYSEL
tara:strand:- start:639 stop:1580 length:942 start_codon:yes stop_codon:yes gene_type:complete